MNILVTGCAGFIGSHAVEYFLLKNYNVAGLDNLTYAANVKNMNSFIDKIKFFKHDVCDTGAIKKIVIDNNIAWIINFAAETHVDNSIKSCDSFISSNITGVKSLLDVCRSTGCKFFQISTDEVYGSSRFDSFDENDKLSPRNPYSATKAAAEHFVFSYQNTYKVNFLMVRMSNNFGPRQHNEKFLPTIIKSLANGKKIPVYGDGKNIRDWLYVKDCVKLIEVILAQGSLNEVYNLTYNNEMENLEIISRVCDIMKKNVNDSIKFILDRPGHDFRYSISRNKLDSFDIEPQTNFQKALLETAESYLGN